jgi:D-alanine-D-alanine ligase
MNRKNVKLIILYSDSEFTPWKENITPDTLVAVLNATSLNYKTAITHFCGFNESFASFLKRFDLVVNLCYGFDRFTQTDVVGWLDGMAVPHSSSTVSAQLLAQDKAKLPALCNELGIDTPALLTLDDVLGNKEMMLLKPRFGSLHRGIRIFSNGEITIEEVLNPDNLIQPYIYGREFTVAVIPGKEGDDYVCLPPAEIIPIDEQPEFIAGNAAGRTMIDYEPDIKTSLRNKITGDVLRLHKKIGLRGMSRTDVRVEGNTVYILDVNAMPNLEPNISFLPLIARHHGISYHELVQRLLGRFLNHYYSKAQLYS